MCDELLSTLLLLSVVHSDLKDGRSLISQQGGNPSDGVQLVNAATTVLVPEQEVFVVAQTEGVVQLLTFVHRLVMTENNMLKDEKSLDWIFVSQSYSQFRLRENVENYLKLCVCNK